MKRKKKFGYIFLDVLEILIRAFFNIESNQLLSVKTTVPIFYKFIILDNGFEGEKFWCFFIGI